MKIEFVGPNGGITAYKNNTPTPPALRKNSLDNMNLNNTNLNGVFPGVQGITKNQRLVLEAAANPLLISNQRQLLSYIYKNVGVVAAMIDAPVDDAFRGGIIITEDDPDFDADKIKQIQRELKNQAILRTYIQAEKWARLFGGAGIIIEVVGQDPAEEFDINKLKKGDKVNFYAADLWELNTTSSGVYGEEKPYLDNGANDCPYVFWGQPLHKSRVIKIQGKEAPSQLRLILRGWGMSMLESMIDPLANYYELNNLTSNYIDQAKIDVFKFTGLNDALAMDNGIQTLWAKASAANMSKSINNGLMIDSEDDYIAKQTTFAGISDLREQNRIELGASTRLPLTKTYGISSPSFNNGEDGQENYAGMVESTIRAPSEFNLIKIVQILCQITFGTYPSGINIKFPPLRILGLKEEQDQKSKALDGFVRMYDRGLITPKVFKELCNAAGITPIKLDPMETPKTEDFPEPPAQKPTLDLYGDDSKERNKLGS